MSRAGRIVILVLGLCGLACESAPPRAAPSQVRSEAQPQSQIFGTPPKLAGAPLDVEQVLAAPKTYLRQTIKCQGTVSRVCEAAGCWLELRADAGGAGLRVPMAGHSFFVPQSIVGKRAVVEGTLSARELSDAELAHLRGEGLEATGPLFLAATSVVVAEFGSRGAQSELVTSERSRFR